MKYPSIIAALLLAAPGVVQAGDGPNLVPNGSFEGNISDWTIFGNAFQNSEYAADGFFSLKMFGCFCGEYNAAGGVSTEFPASSGQVYRVNADVLTAGFDSIIGTQNWAGIKVEFRNASGTPIGLAEERVIVGTDASEEIDVWQLGDFICEAPFGTATMIAVPVFLQPVPTEGGSVFLDNIVVAESERDPVSPIINGGFDLGVDYSYQILGFNGWTEAYGNNFFDDALYKSPPFSAGMFGSFPDYDGDGNCDPGGVSGLNQLIPGINPGDVVTLDMSAITPSGDSIIGTDNFVLAKIEFLGTDPGAPIASFVSTILDGTSDAADQWYDGQVVAEAPDGTLGIRIVAQIVQPDCGAGSVRIDDVMVTVGGEPPADDCTGDFNGDGVVDGADFGGLLAAWGACSGCDEDLNGDGFVNGADIGGLLAAWGDCPDDNGGGGDPGDSNCDEVHSEPGCTDPVCEEIVCNLDPICCSFTWDAVCVQLAIDNCP